MFDDDIKLHKVTGKEGDTFVGMRIRNGCVHIFHPESYPLDKSEDSFYNDILSLFRTFARYNKATYEDEINNVVSKGISVKAFKSYIWLIKDYIVNGIPEEKRQEYKTNGNGKINWKKTISNIDPIISDGTVVYPSYITNKIRRVDGEYAKVYRYCLKTSLGYFGWLFNIKNCPIISIDSTFNHKKSINFVKRRLFTTFSDIDKIRLMHLLKILEGCDSSDSTGQVEFGVNEYYPIFESMVDYYFGNVDNIADFYPGATWHLKKQNFEPLRCNPLRPDTVMIDGEMAYIIDSKFYRYGSTAQSSQLPDITSIQKQITYGDFVKNNNMRGVKKVFNIFLIPYDRTASNYYGTQLFESEDALQFVGYADTDWRDGSLAHEKILTFLIDLKYLVKRCNQGVKGADSKWLMQLAQDAELKIRDLESN